MTTASKLIVEKRRCEARWATGERSRCTQVAKYRINTGYYCTTHAKIRALQVILDA